MDKFSFLNAVHAQLIDDMYEQYKKYPDALEPSWKSFFQGFDFALENYSDDDFGSAPVSNSAPVQYAQQAVTNNAVSKISQKNLRL
jgi:2-oxoglutarate dehydrogenase E1 component